MSRAARLEAAAGWYAELQDEALAAEVGERFCLWELGPANAAAFREIRHLDPLVNKLGIDKAE